MARILLLLALPALALSACQSTGYSGSVSYGTGYYDPYYDYYYRHGVYDHVRPVPPIGVVPPDRPRPPTGAGPGRPTTLPATRPQSRPMPRRR